MKKTSLLAINLFVILSLSLNSCKKCGNHIPDNITSNWKVLTVAASI